MPVSPVDWGLAERVAVRVSGHEPLAASYRDRLAADFAELTAQAEELVAYSHRAALGQRPLQGPGGGPPRRLGAGQPRQLRPPARPLTDKMAERIGDKQGFAAMPAAVSRRIAGVEVGTLLGWMATACSVSTTCS